MAGGNGAIDEAQLATRPKTRLDWRTASAGLALHCVFFASIEPNWARSTVDFAQFILTVQCIRRLIDGRALTAKGVALLPQIKDGPRAALVCIALEGLCEVLDREYLNAKECVFECRRFRRCSHADVGIARLYAAKRDGRNRVVAC